MARNLLILAYHRVLDHEDPIRTGDIQLPDFAAQMKIVSKFFNPVSLSRAASELANGTLPPRSVAVTFDDGYADNLTVALPVLRAFDIPATVFVATGFIDGGTMWNDKVIETLLASAGGVLDLRDVGLDQVDLTDESLLADAASRLLGELKYMDAANREEIAGRIVERIDESARRQLMLSTSQLRELHDAGVDIGAHTVSHPILASLDSERARREIRESKQFLESHLGSEVSCFAYPNGRPGIDYDSSHVDMVREAGFKAAVATCSGIATGASDALQLPRFGPWGENPLKFFARVLSMHWRPA